MSGWKFSPLASVATIERSSIQPENIENDTLYVGLEHIISGGELMPPQRVQMGDLASSKFRFTEHHILYGKLRPYLAKIAQPDFAGICSTDILPILPSEALDRRFLVQFLRQPAMVRRANNEAVGANLPRISPSTLGGFEIPMPPLEEQQRIADILDKADALRAQRRAALAELDALTQSIFIEMFGDGICGQPRWPRVPLSDAYWFQEGPGVRKWQFTDTGVKLLNVGNIEKDGSINLEKTDRHVSLQEANEKYKHFLVEAGDLVIASSGISFDDDGLLRTRGGFIAQRHLPLCMNTSTIRFKATAGVSTLKYLQAWITSRDFRTQITRLVTGSAQQNFGPSHLNQLQITLPPLAEQERFVTRSQSIDRAKSLGLLALAELDTLFASLQHRAFRGEL